MLDWFPENISTYGGEIDSLFNTIYFWTALAFVISLFLFIYPMFAYTKKQGHVALYIKGDNWKQLRLVVLAMFILSLTDFYILYAEHSTWHDIEEQVPEPDLHIGVTGRQWNWIFIYPGSDSILYTADDVVVNQQNSTLHVPINKNIVFDLKSVDVLHSFSVPNARFKQDVVPGRTITRWFNLTKTGTYEIQCAELCGVLHSKMRNFLSVDSETDFQTFIDSVYSNNNIN